MGTERVFFNKLVTKNLTATDSDQRFFEGYLTVEMVDKQNEINIVDELMKVLPVWMSRDAPISDTHSNRIVGKGINFQKTTITENGVAYPAIFIQGMIHKEYELDNEIWQKIQNGTYKGLSFGGATKSERVPVTNKDGTTSYALKDLEHYEVAVCEDPAVPLALITSFNPIAKAMIAKNGGSYTQRTEKEHCIKCYGFGCYVDKTSVEGSIDIPVSDKSFQDTKIVDDSPQASGLEDTDGEHPDKEKSEEWSATDGVNRPQIDDTKIEKKDPPKVTAGNQKDPTGECFEAVAHQAGQPSSGMSGMSSSTGLGYTAEKGSNTTNTSFEPNEEILGAAGKAEDEEEKEKTLNPGENMNMEKPIRGLRGTGGGVGGGGGSAMMAGAKAKMYESFTELKQKKICTQEYLKEIRKILTKYDYDMRGIVDDEQTNDPRLQEKEKIVGPSLGANNGEDGKSGSISTNDDTPADAFAGTGGETGGSAKSDLSNYSGGTRGGSYENTSQDPQQWDARVTESPSSHTRDTKRIRSGEKDSLNTINTAMKSIEDKLQAIEIRRSVKKFR